jgi:hypothetical protein
LCITLGVHYRWLITSVWQTKKFLVSFLQSLSQCYMFISGIVLCIIGKKYVRLCWGNCIALFFFVTLFYCILLCSVLFYCIPLLLYSILLLLYCYSIVFHCVVLCCVVLCCVVLCCVVLCCVVLCCVGILLCCISCITLRCIRFYSVLFYNYILFYSNPNFSIPI